MIILGLLVTSAGYGLFAVAGSVEILLLCRIVQGLGGGTIGVVQAYVADASLPEQRTRSLGWLSAVTSLAAVLGPALGSLLVAAGGRWLPGAAAAILALAVAAFAWRYLSDPPVLETLTSNHPITSRAAITNVVRQWRDPAARLIWLYAIGIGAFYGIIPIVPLLLQERLEITAATVGPFFMYLGAMGVLMRAFALGPMVDRLGEARLARAGIVALGAGLAFVGLGHDFVPIAIGFTLMPIGTACLFPAITSMLSIAVRRSQRGFYLGVQQTFGGVTRVIFPILGGAAMDSIGVGTPFVLAGVLVLLAYPLTVGFRRMQPEGA